MSLYHIVRHVNNADNEFRKIVGIVVKELNRIDGEKIEQHDIIDSGQSGYV